MNANESAYPTGDHNMIQPEYGLSKRELFAGMAMQGLLSDLSRLRREGFKDSEISEFSRIQADLLIEQLNK